MAVWGRAIAVVAVLGALTACEYAEDGEPRPAARPSSSAAQPDVFPAPATPDAAWLARMDRRTAEVNRLLGTSGDLVFGMVGGLGDGHSAEATQGTSDAIPAGDYVFRVACAGDKDIHFQRLRSRSTPEGFTISCGKVTEIRRTLPGGTLTVELAGLRQGTEAVGGVRVVKAPAKAPPNP
ncbi:hypothetical protein [Arthrobacter sp. R-11]|uniref:hypothetical protein n=1 Tax=Arthrobacter sp. R-11 TaxID=3404053 RepID=UPI003CECFA42